MAANQHEKCNNQPKTSVLVGHEMEWDERTMVGAEGTRFNCFGGNRVGRGGKLR